MKRCVTEVGQFEFSQVADEKVLRLQVSMKDPLAVDEGETSNQLEHKDLRNIKFKNILQSKPSEDDDDLHSEEEVDIPARYGSADLRGVGSCTAPGPSAAPPKKKLSH